MARITSRWGRCWLNSHAPDLLPLLYEMEPTSGWHQGMEAITQSLLERQLSPSGARLEIGCGGGMLLSKMARQSPTEQFYGIERHPLALAYASARFSDQPNLHFMQADLHNLPFTPENFSVVLALDTLDQQGVDFSKALAEIWRVLQPQGLLLLRVSTYQWLQGWHDSAFKTEQRYSKADLIQIFQKSGFERLTLTYCNTLLAPEIILARLLQRWLHLSGTIYPYRSSSLNRLIGLALKCEAHWLKHSNLPFGLSIYTLLQKETT